MHCGPTAEKAECPGNKGLGERCPRKRIRHDSLIPTAVPLYDRFPPFNSDVQDIRSDSPNRPCSVFKISLRNDSSRVTSFRFAKLKIEIQITVIQNY